MNYKIKISTYFKIAFGVGKVGYPCFWADNPDTRYQIPLITL